MKKFLKKSSIGLATSLMSKSVVGVLGATATLLGVTTVHAESVKREAGKTVLEINTSKQATGTAMFHLDNENTVVMDIYGVDRNFQNVQVENDPLIESVTTRVSADRARVVIKLKEAVKYNSQIVGNKVLATFELSNRMQNINSENIVKVNGLDSLDKNESLVSSTNTSEAKWVETNVRKSSLTDKERQEIIDRVNAKNNNVYNKKQVVIAEPLVITPVATPPVNTVVVASATSNTVTVVPPVQVIEPVQVIQPGVPASVLNVVELKKINIKKDNSKVTKITFDLSSSKVEPIVKKVDGKLLIDFNGVSIPNELQRRLATDSLGTAVKVLDVSTQNNQGRVMIEVKDSWDYSFYQADNQFALIIKSIDEKEAVKKYSGKPLTISFQDIDVRAVLQVIADFTNLNIMTSDSVAGSMTLRLKDVPWDQALDLVLEARGLQKIKEGNVIRIATNEEVEKNNDSKLKLKNQNAALESLKLEFFQINYYKAEDLKAVLEGEGAGKKGSEDKKDTVKLVTARGSVGVDTRNNILMVQDTEESLQYVRNIIKKLDIPTRQVLVEAKIVLATENFGKELGARFGIRGYKQNTNSSIGLGNTIVGSGTVAGGSTDPIGVVSSLAAGNLNGFSAGSIGFTLLNVSGNALGLELNALENKNEGKVLSSPRLLTTDNKKAVIEQGTEIPYVTPGSANSPPTISFKKAVLKLDVTPQITPNGRVIMDLEIRKDTVGQLINVQGGGQVPSIDTRNMQNQVTVANGQTVVLGGVYEITNRNDVTKVPFFGDLPILGNFFRNKSKEDEKAELLIFITPHVIEDEDLSNEKPVEINLSKN